MSKRKYLIRQGLIINRVRRNPCNFKELERYLERESEIQGYDLQISHRTFQRDLEDILSLYQIQISYNRSKGVYFIEHEEQSEYQERAFEAINILSALNLTDHTSPYIHFEKRQPKGTEYLHEVLYAIKSRYRVSFTYQKYWIDEISDREGDPLALKEYRNRWYLLLRETGMQEVKVFPLDRVSEFQILNRSFTYPSDFDVHAYFKHSFGIMKPNAKEPEEVVLSFFGFQGKYIKSLPLHPSQKILEDKENEIRVQLKVFITQDFIMELLSFGDQLKVVKPKSLANKMQEIHKKASML